MLCLTALCCRYARRQHVCFVLHVRSVKAMAGKFIASSARADYGGTRVGQARVLPENSVYVQRGVRCLLLLCEVRTVREVQKAYKKVSRKSAQKSATEKGPKIGPESAPEKRPEKNEKKCPEICLEMCPEICPEICPEVGPDFFRKNENLKKVGFSPIQRGKNVPRKKK